MRLRYLARLANTGSWQRAKDLFYEMRAKGLPLPASETLELIEVGRRSLPYALHALQQTTGAFLLRSLFSMGSHYHAMLNGMQYDGIFFPRKSLDWPERMPH